MRTWYGGDTARKKLMLILAGPVEEVCGYAMTSAVHRMENRRASGGRSVRWQNQGFRRLTDIFLLWRGALRHTHQIVGTHPFGESRLDVAGAEIVIVLRGDHRLI